MKAVAKLLTCTATLLCVCFFSQAQIMKNIGNRVKQKAEQRANQKIDNAIDKGLDKAEEPGQKKETTGNNGKNNNDVAGNSSAGDVSGENNSSKAPAGFKTYSKFDFIPGDKIIVYEDFSQDAIGDFPGKWNTNSSGEIVTADGQAGHFLMISKKGRFIPEYINSLPDNFTLQFSLLCNEKFSFYSNALDLFLLSGTNNKDMFENGFMGGQKRSGVKLYFHPVSAGNSSSTVGVETWEDGKRAMENEVSTNQFNSHKGKNKVNVSIWRQKQRVRVYLNEEKVLDLPRAFAAGKTYSSMMFQILYGMANDQDRYLVGNIKLGIGAPDTRNKLITEGRFVTRGILFDVNSDKIKPESYGVLKDIAGVLKENSGIKIKIIGHTDADGTDADNLALSKQRAESVKTSLVKEFGIDGSKIETDGKGESQPTDKNTSAEAKANNRRVEFVRF